MPTPTPVVTPSPAATPSPIHTPLASPAPTPNLTAAKAAASTILVKIPNSPVWGGCAQLAPNFASCPFDISLVARLNYLTSISYFSDAPPGVCGEDYLTGTQNGLFVAPLILSTTAQPDGSFTVVIKRGLPPPNLTATMRLVNGHYLATDLASGAGLSASIFSAHPNC